MAVCIGMHPAGKAVNPEHPTRELVGSSTSGFILTSHFTKLLLMGMAMIHYYILMPVVSLMGFSQ